jgi:hypothetical protein
MRAAAGELHRRLDAVEADLRRLTPHALALRVRSVGDLAEVFDLRATATLAHALDRELARAGRVVAARPYLDAMRDALDVAPEDEVAFTQLSFAAIGARMMTG